MIWADWLKDSSVSPHSLCIQGYVCVGHLSADHSGLLFDRGLARSLPYTSGLGQAVAGKPTHVHACTLTHTFLKALCTIRNMSTSGSLLFHGDIEGLT